MTEQQQQRVREIIAEVLQIDPSMVENKQELEAELGADSLDYMEISIRLESEFGSVGEEPQFDVLTTVQDVIDLIEQRIG